MKGACTGKKKAGRGRDREIGGKKREGGRKRGREGRKKGKCVGLHGKGGLWTPPPQVRLAGSKTTTQSASISRLSPVTGHTTTNTRSHLGSKISRTRMTSFLSAFCFNHHSRKISRSLLGCPDEWTPDLLVSRGAHRGEGCVGSQVSPARSAQTWAHPMC